MTNLLDRNLLQQHGYVADVSLPEHNRRSHDKQVPVCPGIGPLGKNSLRLIFALSVIIERVNRTLFMALTSIESVHRNRARENQPV